VWWVGTTVVDKNTACTLWVKGKVLLLSSDSHINARQYTKVYCLHPLQLAQCVLYNDRPLGFILRL
jgi:hypothetical protein